MQSIPLLSSLRRLSYKGHSYIPTTALSVAAFHIVCGAFAIVGSALPHIYLQ